MNEQLALRTLSTLLSWDHEAQTEFEWLRLMSKFKYDAYQGYEPGLRFFESLIGWLHQFSDLNDRKTAYNFLKTRLMFFSRNEIAHLVHRLYPYVRETLSKAIALSNGMKPYEIWANETTRNEYDICLRKTLFVGLSDGAMMDVFRRANEGKLSNEQIVVAHEISDPKWKSMKGKLGKRISDKNWKTDCCFEHVFLIDDFTASGTSAIDKDAKTGEWGGKIHKFITSNLKHIESGLLKKPCHLNVHHYLATEDAKANITPLIVELEKLYPQFKISLNFGHIIENNLKITAAKDPEFFDLLTKHYDTKVETDISKNVQFGYKTCALAVALEHNTPNNTVSLIWAESEGEISGQKMKPLFRRRTRH